VVFKKKTTYAQKPMLGQYQLNRRNQVEPVQNEAAYALQET